MKLIVGDIIYHSKDYWGEIVKIKKSPLSISVRWRWRSKAPGHQMELNSESMIYSEKELEGALDIIKGKIIPKHIIELDEKMENRQFPLIGKANEIPRR